MRKLISILLIVFLLTGTVLAAGGTPKIVDKSDLLSDAEETQLEAMAQHLADTYGMDVVIVTVPSLNGKSAQAYADDYFDYNGYGIGSDYSGILLLISMEYREWAISTCGKCIQIFSDRELDNLFNSMSSYLSGSSYYRAFYTYLEELESHFRNYLPGSTGTTTVEVLSRLAIALLIGAAAGGITLAVMRGNMNTARRQSGAASYLTNGSFRMYRQQDIYLYSQTSRTRKQESSSGGGSVHHSSSGRSHGGRSGRF